MNVPSDTTSRSESTNAKFISFEGSEGSGKSTNIAYACSLLEQRKVDYILTREPGGTEIGEKVREILLADGEMPLDAMAELLLVFSARAQHIAEKIKPALAAGKWVICDRFTDATYAYQGVARGLGSDKVALLEDLVQCGLKPDKTILLDVDVEVGRRRAMERGELDRFEKESQSFFQRVRQAYLDLAEEDPARFVVIDAGRDLDAVRSDLAKSLAGLL